MAEKSLKERLSQGILILDGGMGTQLVARGVESGKCNEYLNIESPDLIFDIHCAYLAAGSQAVITNTFGANRIILERHGLADDAEKINRQGAKIARRAAGDENYVLGNIGPTGDFLEPLGSLSTRRLKEAFMEQVEALAQAGADGIIIETMTAIDEITIAVEAASKVCNLPIFASMAFDGTAAGFRTMMGVDPAAFVSQITPLGVEAVGFNCGDMSLTDYVNLAGEFARTVKLLHTDVNMFAEPNAGKPKMVEGQTVYDITPAQFVAAVRKIRDAGITILGGCCGTNPDFIAAVARDINA